MADFTSSGWVAGETVSVYAVGSAPPNGRVGSALATAVASSSGAAAFTGLSSSTPYVAVGGTSGRSARFSITQPLPAQSGSAPDVLARDGGPALSAGWEYMAPLWYPNNGVRSPGPDTQFLQDFFTERELVDRGGQLSISSDAYWAGATDKATLVTGPFLRPAVGAKTTADGGLLIPAGGLIDPFDYTVSFLLRPVSAEGSTLTGKLLWIGPPDVANGIYISKASASTISARQYINGTPGAEAIITGLTTGDLASGAWTAVSVTLSGTTLTLRIGNNAKHASVTTALLTWWALENGAPAITPLTDAARTGVSGAFQIAEMHIGPARTPGPAIEFLSSPRIAVDFATDDGSIDLRDLGGLFGQYSGWSTVAADGESPASGAEAGTAVRDQIFATIGADGCTLVRIDHATGKLSMSGSGAGLTIDTSQLQGPMDALHALGVKFHVSLNGTPTGLRGVGGENAVPSSTSDYAIVCSKLVTWMKSRGYEFFLAGWNEPDNGGFWAGSAAQMATLWLAVQAKLATDHPDIEFGGVDGIHVLPASGAADPGTNVLIEALAADRPVPFIVDHTYEPDYDQMALWTAIRTYLVNTVGYDAAPSIRVGEWAVNSTIGNIYAASGTSYANSLTWYRGHPVGGLDYCSQAFRKMANYALDGDVLSATFSRMGGLDASFGGAEQLLALFTNTNPPRPLPAYPAFQAIWKCSGQPVQTTITAAPRLKAVAARDDSGLYTLAYGSHRAWDRDEIEWHAFEWAGLPTDDDGALLPLTWTQYRFDARDCGDTASSCVLVEIGSGDETNLPLGTDLSSGVGVIQITGEPPVIADAAPSFSVAPAISGTALVGSTLTCNGGTVTGSPTPTKTYQWKRAGTNLSGATSSTYVLVSGDVAGAITCTVTATNGVGSPATATSNAITPAVPVNTIAPAITGSAVTGQTLTRSTGTWTSAGSPTYTQTWQRDGVDISGATASTYVLQVADESHVIRCRVTATDANGAGTATNSNTVTPTASATAPAQVTGLSLTPGDTQIVANWSAPSNGGSAITDYLVQIRNPGGSGSYTTFSDGTSTSTSATITGLTNGTSVDVKVSAINAIGTGTASAPQSATPASGGVSSTPPVTANLVFNIDAQQHSASDGDPVATTTDRSGNGNTFAQSTSGKRPTYVASGINGRPAFSFDGGDCLESALASTTKPLTLYAIVNVTSLVGSRSIMGSTTPSGIDVRVESDGTIMLLKQQIALIMQTTGALSTGANHLVVVTYDGTGHASIAIDSGSAETATSDVTFGTASVPLVSLGDTGSVDVPEPWLGMIGHWLEYNAAHTGTSLSDMKTWLRSYWGLS